MSLKTRRMVGAGSRDGLSSAGLLFLFAALFAAAAPVRAQYDFDHPDRPQETSDCPENSVFVPGSSCVASGRPSCVALAINSANCGSSADVRLDMPIESDDPLGDSPEGEAATGYSCPSINTAFWVGIGDAGDTETTTIGNATCAANTNGTREAAGSTSVGCCFNCGQARQVSGFCQAVPAADTPDCAKPGFAHLNPGACEADPDRPECADQNCTDNFAGSSCCVEAEDPTPPTVPKEPPPDRPPPPVDLPGGDGGGDTPNGGGAGPGNHPPGHGVAGDDGRIEVEGSPGAGKTKGIRSPSVQGAAKGAARIDACAIAQHFHPPCDPETTAPECTYVGDWDLSVNSDCRNLAALRDSPVLNGTVPCTSPAIVRCRAAIASGADPGSISETAETVAYPAADCNSHVEGFNDDCDSVCDEPCESVKQNIQLIQCPGNSPTSDAIKVGETYYCNASYTGAQFCPRAQREACSETAERVSKEDLEDLEDITPNEPGDPNGFCAANPDSAECDEQAPGASVLCAENPTSPLCTSDDFDDFYPGPGTSTPGFTFTFSNIGVTLSGLFAAPENSLSTVLITIPDNSVRTVTVSGVEFVVVDQSILQEVVSVVFCDEGDSGCMAALAINPIDANLVTVFISGDGAETTNAEFVFGDVDEFRFTGNSRPACVSPIWGFSSDFLGQDLSEFVDSRLFLLCDILEGDGYGTGITLADFFNAVMIFLWLMAGVRLCFGA